MARNITSVADLESLRGKVIKYKEPGDSSWQFAYLEDIPAHEYQGGGYGCSAVSASSNYLAHALLDVNFARGLVVREASESEKRGLTWPSNVHPS